MPVVRRIVKKAAQNDYRLSSIVMGIVESAPFQMRTKLEPAEDRQGPSRLPQKLYDRITRSSHVHYEEAPFAPHVHAWYLGRHGRTAVPGRHGSGALRGADVAVPVRRGLLPVRRVSRHLASRGRGEQLRVQAGDAAAGAVPQSTGHGQQDEGAVGRVGPSGRQLGVPERRRAGRPPRRERRRFRKDPIEEDRRPVHRRSSGRRYAAAVDRSRHRGHGHRRRRLRRLRLHVLQHAVVARRRRARCRWGSIRA